MTAGGKTTVAIVTGGAGGIGYECARQIGGAGAAVVLFDVRQEALEEAVERLSAESVRAYSIALDVTREEAVRAAVATVIADVGSPGILLNAAGVLRRSQLFEITSVEWDMVIDSSLKATFLCSVACLPSMIEAGLGPDCKFLVDCGKERFDARWSALHRGEGGSSGAHKSHCQ